MLNKCAKTNIVKERWYDITKLSIYWLYIEAFPIYLIKLHFFKALPAKTKTKERSDILKSKTNIKSEFLLSVQYHSKAI